ncbi:membrane protein [Catellatospora methionotrophica]|uniref:Membrane protein n=1 Tax=Catellatospora methionotrophica TaxID=121620 RepID=A0A8J3LC23_9ACTN|nr:anthrone oxygenase family protein [Catellatospora methionotrophica]GIG15599.1 membrane protein [Catellatospora methionotrophica]
MDIIRMVVPIAATVTMGIMAGVFGLYSHTVMPGLRRTDDRTFVGAFQALDRAIINPWFMLGGFLGALVFTAASALLLLGAGGSALAWTVAALVLYLVAFVVTVAVNVPMNNAIKAAGDPDGIADLAGLRAAFDEARWSRWNHVRTVATTVALICLAVALLRYGR